jgi:uncharacterized membrane protein YbaN (DUF454 family)
MVAQKEEKKTMWRWLGWACLGLLVLVIGLAGTVRSLLWFPPAQLDVAVTCPADTPPVPTGSDLSVLVWNVQYAASRAHHFFYDGGQVVHVPASDVTATLDEMARVVRELDPDVVLWQELDRDSDRTGNVDQLQEMLQRTPYALHCEHALSQGRAMSRRQLTSQWVRLIFIWLFFPSTG